MFVEEIEQHSPMCRRGEGFVDNFEFIEDNISGRAVPYGKTIQLMPGILERFEKGSFARQVKDPARVKICLEHGQVVGKVKELEERDDGLYFVGPISRSNDIPEAAKARAMLKDDLADELSIGFMTVKGGTEIERDNDMTLYRHRRARLLEISIVPWGAYGRNATLSRSVLLDPFIEAKKLKQAEARAWVERFRR